MTAISQSGKCCQTVPLTVGDSITDYLTFNEKRNLLKLQLILEQKQQEINYLHASSQLDSAHIVQLTQTAGQLQQQIALLLTAKDYNDKAYSSLHAAYKKLERQLKLLRIRNALVTAAASAGSLATGIGITFLIIKAR